MKTLRNTIIVLPLAFMTFGKAQKTESHNPGHKTFILVHGSWHSAWNWFKVTPLLEELGHSVYAPDLPAMGRDKTPVKEVRFDKTVQLLCERIDSIPGKVVLVGHSKNGVLISQIAENRPDKVEKLVYLAAVLAKNNRSALDYFKLDKEEILGPHITYHPETNSSTIDSAIFKEGLYHDCDDEITEMAKIILSNEPRESATAPIHISEKNWGSVPRYYIECTLDRAITPSLQQKMYEEIPCKKVYQLATSHSPFFSKPKELVDILIEIASEPAVN